MFTISFSSDSYTKHLEALIMQTREELKAGIAGLAESIVSESAQIKDSVAAAKAVLDAAIERISALEASALVASDYTDELNQLRLIKAEIEGIYVPAPVEPDPVPVVE